MAEEKRLTLSDAHDWLEFRVGDLFNVSCGKMTKVDKDGTLYPVVSACTTNNAIIGYTDSDSYLTDGNCLTIGQQTAYCTYQSCDFVGTNNVVILKPIYCMNSYIGLFISNQINVEITGKFNYGRKLSASRAIDVVFNLPATPDGKPDYDFMENYIKQLYDDFADRVSVYTEPVKENKEISLSDREWKEFQLQKIFDIRGSKNYNKNKIDDSDWYEDFHLDATNYVTRTSFNNGVAGHIKSGKYVTESGNALTIGIEGMVCFYQKQPFICGTNITVLRSKQMNQYSGLFIQNCINIASKGQYSYGARGFTLGRVKEQMISLPVTPDGQPDYEFMEQYIKSLPFSKALEL